MARRNLLESPSSLISRIMATERIETLLDEQRRFTPPDQFRKQAHVHDTGPYERARRDPEGYWADWAKQLEWIRPWDRVLEWKPPHAKWFLGGKLNVSANCLDRHVRAGRSGRVALIWEGEPPGEVRRITYGELHAEVNKFANVLKSLGIGRGDRVAIYLPMVPEVAVAMLACARIGAVHTGVFGGFSAESLRDRIYYAGANVLITADGGYRTHVSATTKWVFDLKDSDVFWCTADVGWVTGHSYVVYGPLALGVTEVMYEGAPDHPGKDRFWAICAKHGVTVFYTAPAAI